MNSDKKFWTDVKINGIFLNENIKSSLILYKNNTFAITCDFIENSCIYQGEYEIIKQKITLKRDNIINITDSLFTNEYTINYKDSVLVPNNTNFEKIKILNNDNQ